MAVFGRPVWAAITVATLVLAGACSGGGGGGGGSPIGGSPPPAPPPPPAWTQGVFAPASTFKDRCQVVRTGVDFEGRPFSDIAGSLAQELFWLRSWTNETYLWPDEVTDRDPRTFTDRLAYFATLRTTATTPSGADKDDFHFSQPTDEFLRQRNSAPRAGYGARLVAFSTTVPRDYRIQYTDPATPASTVVNGQPNFVRGTRILRVDGVDLVNGGVNQAEINILNAGLFPANPGEAHTFVVRDPGATTDRTVTLTSANVSPKPVNRTSTIDTPTGRVGYILFNTFSPLASETEIYNAINAMRAAGVNDLVLDLRYNGGGLLAVASQLSYMVAGSSRTSGRNFERLRFNAAAGTRNPVTGQTNSPIPFYTTGLGFSLTNGVQLGSLNLPRVFVLSTGATCSASEAVINGLRGINVEVILIGNTTCGKPFGFYPQDNCGETYYTIQFQGVNHVGFGDYADGFIPANSSAAFGVRLPGCAVADDYSRELGDVNERLLAAALQFRATGTCPAQAAEAVFAQETREPGDEKTALPMPPDSVMWTNRDMRMPY